MKAFVLSLLGLLLFNPVHAQSVFVGAISTNAQPGLIGNAGTNTQPGLVGNVSGLSGGGGGGSDITNGLVGWWTFNEGSGSSTADASGNGRTASLINSPSWQSGLNGMPAIGFDGSTQEAQFSITGDLNSFTISCWVSPVSVPVSFGGFIAESFGNDNFLALSSGVGNWQYYDGNNIHTIAAYQPETWTFVAFTCNALTAQLFTNGIACGSSFTIVPALGSGQHFDRFGSDIASGDNRKIQCLLMDVRIYNRSLSPTEVAALNSNGPK